MDLKVKGKRALVTGSTAGIGYATAEGLAREGAIVILNSRTKDKVDAAMARIRAAVPGASVEGIAADVITPEGAEAVIRHMPEVDILVNNVGGSVPGGFFKLTDDDWSQQWNKNVMSGIKLARHYADGMRKRNWGRVVFVSSHAAYNIAPEAMAYGVTKFAQLAASRALAVELRGTGVTVNSVLVGPTRTERSEAQRAGAATREGKPVAQIEEEFFTGSRANSILRRFVTADETAALIIWLASDASSAISGASMRNEGGMIASP